MTIAQDHPFLAGFSPNSSPDASSMLYDDDSKDLFDFDDVSPLDAGGKPKKSNGRKGHGPGAADKRATHNAIERARRESLNGRFMTLAEALPSMASVKRPSKSIIVNKALDFVFEAQVKEHALIKENNELRLEVDQLRARLGMSPLPPPAPLLPEQATRPAGAKRTPSVQLPTQQQQAVPDMPSPPFGQAPQQQFQQKHQASPPTSAPISMPTLPAVQQHLTSNSAFSHGQQQQQQSSPTSIFASPLAAADSPASTTGSLDLASSMESLSPYAQTAATSLAPSLSSAYASAAPQFAAAHHAALLQAHYSAAAAGNASAAAAGNAFMGINPSSLMSPQQQQLFFAAHLAQQQQQQQQQHVQQHQQPSAFDAGFGGGYNPMQPAFFMA